MVPSKKYIFLIFVFIGVVFTILASFWTEWTEYTANPVLDPASGVRAYYPSVIYDQNQFNGHGTAAYYKMWFASPDSGSGGIALAYSDDGINWTEYNNSLPLAGLNPGANHPVVLYDPSGFAGGSFYYKTWYWDSAAGLNTINTIRYAESSDGITWQNDQSIQQHLTDQTLQLVDGVSGSYFYHCYGPGSLLYNPTATNVGSGTPDDKSDDSPMTYRYVMYYDSSGEGSSPNGSIEQGSLAYSTDGIYWIRYGNEPVLLPSGDQNHWDGWYSFRGCVKATASGYHMWYSGANGDSSIGTYYAHGIGHASSTDGLNWTKDPDNPVFHVTDGVLWRDVRTYTPSVLYDANQFSGHGAAVNWKMWFTGRTGSNYTIGYADLGDELPVAVMDCISTGIVGEEHCLDGSASYDPDGDTIVEYIWDLAARPAGSSAAMSPADEAQSCFIPDLPGTYTVSLRVASINGGGETTWSEEITCDVTTQDQPPVAEFNCIREGMIGEEACFNGSASYDPDGEDIVEYSWSLSTRPAGSEAVMSPANEVRSCFTPDLPGVYRISLRAASVNADDETVWSEARNCNMTVPTQDQPPAAVFACPAGEEVGKEICLNGSSSYDPDGDEIVEYSWSLPVKPAGSTAVMSPVNEVQSCFTPDLPGTYQVSLRVASVNAADETVWSEETTCSITTRDRPPQALFRCIANGETGEKLCFNASLSSDPDGDEIVEYAWSLTKKPEGSSAAMYPRDAVRSCFIPDVPGIYRISLRVASLNVADETAWSEETTCNMTVTSQDQPPAAVFDCPPGAEVGKEICLNGSSSYDPDGDEIIEYSWGLPEKPAGSAAVISPANSVQSCFTPDLPGTYQVSLRVASVNGADETVWSGETTCSITTEDRLPISVIKTLSTGAIGEKYCFSGSESYDPDGDNIVEYNWRLAALPQGSNAVMSPNNTMESCFIPDVRGTYTVALVVTSENAGGNRVQSIEATLEVIPRDRPPQAVFRCIPNGETGEKLCFNAASSSDPDGDEIVEYTWSLTTKPGGSSAAMYPRDTVRSCFIPDIPGTYVLSLTAASKNISGEIVRSAAAHCEISIKDRIPVAVFACTPSGKVGETICFDASASYDPDGTEITGYSWSILSKPLGSQVELSSQHMETTCFSPDMEGIYSISLQVSSQNSAGETAWSKKTDCEIQIQGYTYCFCPEVVLNVERVEDRMWHKSYKIEKLNWITTCSTPCCQIEKYKIYRMENSNWELVAEVDAHINNFELKDVKEWHEYKVIPFLPGNKECLGRIELNNQLHKPHHPNAGRRKVDR